MKVDVRGAVPDRCKFTNFALISLESTKQLAVLMLCFECYSFKFLDKKERLQDSSSGTAPLMSTLTSPDVTHVTLSPRPSPSVFAYCKRSNTGRGNGLGTRLSGGA